MFLFKGSRGKALRAVEWVALIKFLFKGSRGKALRVVEWVALIKFLFGV